jgi:hypothetical protein
LFALKDKEIFQTQKLSVQPDHVFVSQDMLCQQEKKIMFRTTETTKEATSPQTLANNTTTNTQP